MAESINSGDRVLHIRDGKFGTVLRVDGLLTHVHLDNDVREKFVTAALKKVDWIDEAT